MAEITYAQAINKAIEEEMERDSSVFMMGEDIGVYGGAFGVTRGLLDKFGSERIRDTPISEAAMVGLAAGAAMTGMRPIVEIMFMDFITLAVDQISNHASKFSYIYGGQVKVPLVIRTPAGAGRGYGASHSQSLESWFMHMPGIKVVAPSTPYSAKGMLKSAIRDDNPVLFVENKLLYSLKGDVPEGDFIIPLEKADIPRKGKDLTIISYSRMVNLALESADELAKEGIDTEVIDLRSLSPLDIKALEGSVRKTGHAMIVEEDCLTGGVGAEVAAQLQEHAFSSLKKPVKRIACADIPIPCCTALESLALPDKNKVISAAKELVGR
ncbi:alpha-ketoacid dehydrogenase subunit beta [Candidatus Woesearchaeota archaeon]|nr:alpha-ketoacid dehydrogenase subunit beta [Candidatus Woesearchaeota archaeon]